jgi:hypothetical protein
MCWLRDIIAEKNNVREDMNNMGNGNGDEKRRLDKNWQLITGILVYSATMVLKHTIGLPEFLMGFGHGFGIVLMIIGTLTLAGKNVKKFKKARI